MDELRLSVEITKINLLLETLFALEFKRAGLSAEDVGKVADNTMRHVTGTPATAYGPEPSPEEAAQEIELLAHQLDEFWARVRARI
jgi:hypothetical protein